MANAPMRSQNYKPTLATVRAKLGRSGSLFASDEVAMLVDEIDRLLRVHFGELAGLRAALAGLAGRLESEQMNAIDPNYDADYRIGYNMGVGACVRVVRSFTSETP